MKIVADENISFSQEAFSGFGEVELLHGRKITNASLKDADCLIVRSITNVDRNLLESTPVKFVGTATIGTDHIDVDYLNENKIAFADAKGCNADAVAEYVFTAITEIASGHKINLDKKTIGVAGIGNIGSRIVRISKSLGWNILMNDPPLARLNPEKIYVELEEIFSADIITFHVPLNQSGIDKTVHLLNKENLSLIKDGAILINASRGQVIDNAALFEYLNNRKIHTVLDVWENEPGINADLLKKVELGTPHIAGYSLEGKVNGTKIIYDALCDFLGEEKSWTPELPPVENNIIEFSSTGNLTDDLAEILNSIYNIKRDDKELRKLLWLPEQERGNYFDLLRKNYPLRREFVNYKIRMKNNDERLVNILKGLRFGK